MLVDEARFVDDVKRIGVTFLEGEALVEREAQLARDHVDRGGKEISLQSGRVLDCSHGNLLKMPRWTRPMRIRFQKDVGSGGNLADAIGPVVEPWIGRVGSVVRAHPVLCRIGERLFFDMRRQQNEIVDRGIVEGELVDMHREGLVALNIDTGDPAVELAVADRALRVAANLVSEADIG